MYLVNTPWWLKRLYPASLRWGVQQTKHVQPAVYLSFDDGPHPQATPFVLDALAAHGAKATFFCLGKCVRSMPALFSRIMAEGHATGNHTENHLKGWAAGTGAYVADVARAAEVIPGKLFRPPYGRITRAQITALTHRPDPYTICMWQVLSGDFDARLSPEACIRHVIRHAKPGSIIVFHDSAKALPRLSVALPAVISHFVQQGWAMLPLS